MLLMAIQEGRAKMLEILNFIMLNGNIEMNVRFSSIMFTINSSSVAFYDFFRIVR